MPCTVSASSSTRRRSRRTGYWRRWRRRKRAQPVLKRQPGLEHVGRIEIELGVKTALYVAGLAKAVLLAGKQEIADRIALAPECLDHGFGLVRRHDGVPVALEEHHRLPHPLHLQHRRAPPLP